MGSFDEFKRDLNQKPVSTRSSLIHPNEVGPRQYAEEEDIDREYNSSGRPFNLSELDRVQGSQGPLEVYNSSGRTFNLNEFLQDEYIKEFNDLSSDSDRTLKASGYYGSTPPKQLGPNRSYNESGRVLGLSDFGPTIIPGSRKYVENATPSFKASTDVASTTQNRAESYNTSHGLLNSSNLDRLQNLRLLGSYDEALSTRTPAQRKMTSHLGTPSASIQEKSRITLSPTFRSVAEDLMTTCPQGKRQQVRSPGMRRAEWLGPQNWTSPSQDQLVQFLQNGDISQISVSKPSSSAIKNPLFDTLVRDNYYPGAIQAAVNGQIDFNKVAFDAVFDGNNIPSEIVPEEVPMSLLEAFDMRIEYERGLRENIEGGWPHRRQEEAVKKNKVEEGETIFWTHRDELKLASAIDIELESNIRDQPDTDLTRAITSLFKAEKMNEFDKRVHLAEQAIRSASSPSEQEKAALRSGTSFKVDLQKDEVKSNKTYTPIEIISYIGTTKPAE